MEELWVEINGFEGKYIISNKGRIISTNFNNTGKPKELKQKTNKKTGLCEVALSKNNKRYFYMVSRLVAEHFLDNPMYKEEVMHKSIDKLDNSVENLQWAYKSETRHNMYNKGCRKIGKPTYTKITYKNKNYNTYAKIARDENINLKTFYNRIYNLKWGLYEALEIPVGKKGD